MRRKDKEIHVYLLMCGWITVPRKPHQAMLYAKPDTPTSWRWTREYAWKIERRNSGV